MTQRGEPSAGEMRLVIAASSVGTVFEWYDFFIYGTLAALVGAAFVPSNNDLVRQLVVWAGFAVGFGFRPLGAILFGFLGDRLGRKYTFLITVTLMGIATAGVGLIPSVHTMGLAAPALVIFLRILQGLALGGEYGGAAVYVSEHSPPGKSGFYTGFIQASVIGGFVLSLLVILLCKLFMNDAVWAAWGWRIPFLLSLLYQTGLGFTPLQSGLLIVPQAVGAIFSKVFVRAELALLGYRSLLIGNTVLLGIMLMLFATEGPATPVWLICGQALIYGVLTSTQFTAINTLAYADVPEEASSHASAFASTFQQLSMSFGVATAGLVTAGFVSSRVTERAEMLPSVHHAFLILGGVTILSAAVFSFLRRGDGDAVSGHQETVAADAA